LATNHAIGAPFGRRDYHVVERIGGVGRRAFRDVGILWLRN
jgi:hypothetical protein